MACAVHHKLNSGGDLTELSDDEFIVIPLGQMWNMTFKIQIGNICKVSDNNVRICNCRLHIYFFVIPCNRMYCIWMLSAFYLNYLFKFNFVNILSRRYIGRKDWHVRGRDSMEPTWINEIIHTEEKSMQLSEKGAFVTMTTLRPSGIWMSLNRCY